MDWFYRINIGLLIVMGLTTAGMLVNHEMEAMGRPSTDQSKSAALKKKYEDQLAKNAWIYKEVLTLEKKGEVDEAINRIKKIMKSRPEDAYSLVLLGRLYYKQGHLAQAVHSYRKAIQKDPDYVDKNTPLFIGDEIMKLISSARGKLNREKKLKPNDMQIRTAINDIYYLQRRIAGGCE